MKHLIATTALAVTLAQPASAITFPTLTTIYVGSGVRDDDGSSDIGIATVFVCSNVSGTSALLRFVVLNNLGQVDSQISVSPVANGGTVTVGTHATSTFVENGLLSGGVVAQGVVNIESTQSGVFCSAMVVDAADVGEGIPLHLVRVNRHPGTEE